MPLYEIDGPDGKTYEIEGPAGATREQIIERVKAGLQSTPQEQPQAKAPNPVVDSIRAIPGGLAKGAAALVGLPGDIESGLTAGADWALGKMGVDVQGLQKSREAFRAQSPIPELPTSAGINKAVSDPFGGYYEPQTRAGKYAETIASFAPAAIAPGTAAARTARVAVPGAASEAAGQATEGTPYEPVARAAGALAGGVGVGMAEGALARRANPAPSKADLRNKANQLYATAKGANVEIRPLSYSNMVDNIASDVRQAGTHPKLHPKVAGALEELQASKGSSMPLEDLERLRRIARGAASSIEPDERRVAEVIVDGIDDYMDNLSAGDLITGSPDAGKTLSEARGVWAKLKKSDVIETAIERAKDRATTQNGNYAASLRAEFQALSKNQKKMRGFTPAEKAAIRKVARVGPVTGTMAAVGALRPRGLMALGELGGAALHPEAGLPILGVAAAGQGAQMGLNAMTASRSNRLAEIMRSGGTAASGNAAAVPQNALLSVLSQARP
jgi:hypothetical protein